MPPRLMWGLSVRTAQITCGSEVRQSKFILRRGGNCVFRTKSASDPDSNPPPFPIRSRHGFRPSSATKLDRWEGAETAVAAEPKDPSR